MASFIPGTIGSHTPLPGDSCPLDLCMSLCNGCLSKNLPEAQHLDLFFSTVVWYLGPSLPSSRAPPSSSPGNPAKSLHSGATCQDLSLWEESGVLIKPGMLRPRHLSTVISTRQLSMHLTFSFQAVRF
uniref:Uncharacterized protein n=1 Tax=Sphaerodactylus townsendi TaxID=933632 RepID=A0ACB8EVU8_9SAUR